LPNESKLFKEIVTDYKIVLTKAKTDRKVTQTILNSRLDMEKSIDLSNKIKLVNSKIEKIIVTIEKMIINKKLKFPRFFFISNEFLTSVISRTIEKEIIVDIITKSFI